MVQAAGRRTDLLLAASNRHRMGIPLPPKGVIVTAEIRPIGGIRMRRSKPQTGQRRPTANHGLTATLKEPTHDDLTWALMAYVGQFVLVVFAPTIVLLLKGRSLYIRKHAVQALNLALSVIAVWVAGALLSLVASWLLLVPIAYSLL